MKMSYALFVLLLWVISLQSNAQEYFQQEVKYNIKVSLDDVNHTLSAFEEIEYYNNSPGDLEFIWFHIWPNAYDNNNTALGKQKIAFSGKRKHMNDEEQRGRIDSLDFRSYGNSLRWEYHENHIDICKVFLNEPLKTGSAVVITTPFFVKLPKGNISRLGHVDQSYQVTQWFPKPAVYDNKGWHCFPYLDYGEFYYEYGSFDVSITVPDNYYVAATGILQNEEEKGSILQKAEETAAVTKYDKDDNVFPPSNPERKTLRFKEENIHDFAWFADKRFHIMKGEVKLPHSGRAVTTWAYFLNNEAHLWERSIEYINDAIYYYSLWYGDYPYDNCTAVHSSGSSGGGMEYPQITLIGNSSTAMSLEMVIMHEVGHNWFYGLLGSNEREHPWMDEGVNTFSEIRYFNTKYPDNRLYKMLSEKENPGRILGIEELKYHNMHRIYYLINARSGNDQPASLRSEDYTRGNYAGVVYSKAGISMYYLMLALGEEKFNKCMQAYFEKWKYRHPYPEDLRKIFQEETGQDQAWFFDDLMGSTKKLDYKVSRFKDGKVLVKNKGKIDSPVLLYGIRDEKASLEKVVPGFSGKQWISLEGDKPEKFAFDAEGFTPDLYPKNNIVRTSGVFRKSGPPEVNALGLIEKPGRTSLNILPVAGWNYYNGFMAGGLIYSNLLPLPRFEYQLMPFYSFGSGDLAGMGKLRYNLLPESNTFRMITPYVAAKQFAVTEESGQYFQVMKAGVEIRFRHRNEVKPVENVLRTEYIRATDIEEIGLGWGFRDFYRIGFDHSNSRKACPWSVNMLLEGSGDYLKSILEANYRYVYIYRNSLDVRFYGGAFVYRKDGLSPLYDFSLSGTPGLGDYTYDYLYLARFEDPASKLAVSNQFVPDQGGFGVNSIKSAGKWLTAMNVSSSFPVPKNIPVQIYFN
ncbi:MAG: M1 family metallopeptidase, partial [Bacteroidales bacterium]|nr:M1 family metallopeptidase [Bacteroidales bacterium]